MLSLANNLHRETTPQTGSTSETQSYQGDSIRKALIEVLKRAIPDSLPDSAILCDQLAAVLLEDPEERVGRFLQEISTYTLVLHQSDGRGAGTSTSPCYFKEVSGDEVAEDPENQGASELHINVFAEGLWESFTKTFDDVARADVQACTSGHNTSGHQLIIGSGGLSDEGLSSTGFEGCVPRRGDYDIRAKELPEGLGHTSRQLRINGLRRLGLDIDDWINRDEVQRWLDRAGVRWQEAEVDRENSPIHTQLHLARRRLWQAEYDWLMSDEAIRSKSPGRWFRDLCVLCGVSTVTLSELTNRSQTSFSWVQNGHLDMSVATQDRFRDCLALTIGVPMTVGKRSRAGFGYNLPAGALLGLPICESEIPTSRTIEVSRFHVARVLKLSFNDRYVRRTSAKQILMRLKCVSDAYFEGRLTREETLAANPIVRGSQLHVLLREASANCPELREPREHCNAIWDGARDLQALNKIMTTLNEQHWKLDIKPILEAIEWLPSGAEGFLRRGGPINRSKAWEYAKRHHDGSVRSLLKAHRTACRLTLNTLAKLLGFARDLISAYERGETRNPWLLARALSEEHKTPAKPLLRQDGSLENMWQLPTEPAPPGSPVREVIRRDVASFLREFKENTRPPDPKSGWLDLWSALEESGAIDLEADFMEGREISREDWFSAEQSTASQIRSEFLKKHTAIRDALEEISSSESLPLIELGGHCYLLKQISVGTFQIHQSDLMRMRMWVHL